MNYEMMIEVLQDAEAMYRRYAEFGNPTDGTVYNEWGTHQFQARIMNPAMQFTVAECLRKADSCKRTREHLQGACCGNS